MWQQLVACCLVVAGLGLADDQDAAQVDGPVIGIDLGTTYSCVGVFKHGAVEIIANDQGNRITPSYVAFVDGQRLIGEAAKYQATVNPAQTVFDVKRFIGRRFSDPSVRKDTELLPYELFDQGDKVAIRVKVNGEDRVMKPEQISAMVLTKLKDTAEAYLGVAVENAVITVPAHFSDAQRQATKDAGEVAGLKVLKVLNEPTAAAIAYGMDKGLEKVVLVFDFGGGTLDVSLLRIDGGMFEVIATSGDARLGGEDIDQRVMQHLMRLFEKRNKKSMATDAHALQKLRNEVEKAKRRLSSAPQVKISIEALSENIDFSETLTRARFEELNSELFQRTLKPIEQVLADAKMQKSQVDEVVLVGGSSRIPKVQQLVKNFFDGKELARGINPDEAIAHGAAIQAGLLSKQDGAKEVLLVDVTPLTLGIETVGGVMTKVINRNTAIPCKNTTIFTTVRNNQPAIDLQVYEGERLMTKNNNLLATFRLDGIPPAPGGQPQVEVTFNVDSNGLLSVHAIDRGTGKSEELTVTNDKSRLTPEQIEQMVKDGQELAEEDHKAMEKADAKTSLQVYLHSLQCVLDGTSSNGQVEKNLNDEERRTLEGIIMDGQDWLASNPDAEPAEIGEKRPYIFVHNKEA